VLVACEFSGIVRDAFRARGVDAVSCDLLPCERPGPHITADVLGVLGGGWDLMVAFPPCTTLCNSGNRWHHHSAARLAGLDFVRALMAAPIPRWAIENPPGAINSQIAAPDMVLQPWQYGAAETKQTCLWLRGLPPLLVGELVGGPYRTRVHREPDSRDRWKRRSRTFPGLADAMAEQWAGFVPEQLARCG
jgi:hypothetical protein